MSLRHSILGLLARQPSNGYELTRMFDQSLGTAWHASHSQIYPELAKLEAAGLVEVVERGPRRSRIWGLTEAGREELRRWLVEEDPDRSVRNESGVRLLLTPLLEAADRQAVFERDLAHVERLLGELLEVRDAIPADQPPGNFAPQLELGLRLNTTIRDWLREQVAAAEAVKDEVTG